jgi:phosphoglucomutase
VTIAVGFDTRYFSPEFAQCTADAATERGADVLLFDAPVSSPQLAFTVRTRGATAGVMITASHNPPHDNGYKVYLGDGGQILSEDAAAIAARMASAPSVSSAARGTVTRIGTETDAVFADTIHALALDADARRGASAARIVFTPLHGTGMRVVPRALARLGCAVTEVAAQSVPDGAFPTVASPNPEDPRAYDEGIAIAKTVRADVVIATDPDADRLGVAAREPNGEYRLLSGNQLGAILTAYRLEALRKSGELTAATARRFVVVKTVVTTELIRAIADHYGVRCVDTLTGFKYIGAKLRGYAALPEPRRLVFAGEESFGYLGDDYVRDKDANGTAVMVADAITAFARDGRTLIDAVDDLHVAHGVFVERLENLTLEGVAGAKRIQEILQELRTAPPAEIAGSRVAWVKDHSTDVVLDEDDQPLPKELMVRLGLDDGSVITVRGSGTEPKLKYYFSARGRPRDHAALAETRAALWDRTGVIWSAMRAAAE